MFNNERLPQMILQSINIAHNTCLLAQMMASITNSLVSQPLPSPRFARFWPSMIFWRTLMLQIFCIDQWMILSLMMHWEFAYVFILLYPKYPWSCQWWYIENLPTYLFHNILNSHYSMAAMKMKAVLPPITQQQVLRVIIIVFFFKTFLADSSWTFRRRKNNLIISVRPLLTPEHRRGGSPDQRNSQVIFTKL